MISPRIEGWQLIEGTLPAPQLIDLRDPESFARGHIPGAENIPYEQLQVIAEGRLELALWLRQRGHDAGYLVGGMARWVGELASGAV